MGVALSHLGFAALSGARPPHLQLRAGTFHLRVRVPDDLRLRVGLLEIRRSLRVHTLTKARPLVMKYAARVMESFEVIRDRKLSKDQAHAVVMGCFVDLAAEVDGGFIPSTSQPFEERLDQRYVSLEVESDVEAQLEAGAYGGRVTSLARSVLCTAGVTFDDLGEAERADVLSGMARAFIEQQRLFRFRLDDRLSRYPPQDPLFRREVNFTERAAEPQHALARAGAQTAIGPTVADLAAHYLKAKKDHWATKTHDNRRSQLGLLIDHLGKDTVASTVLPSDLRNFRDALKRLRLNHHVGPGKSFVSRQTDNEGHRIAPKTAALLFETAKAMFRWAKLDGHIDQNPAQDLPNDVVKNPRAAKSRRPFTKDDLITVFAAPVFTGAKALRRRFERGENIFCDAYYWVPLIGFFTGMRLGEIIQLDIDDVRLDGQIPFLEISYFREGEVGTGDKHLKSRAAIRNVPLHPHLMALGFEAFARQRAKTRRGKGRLFFEIAYGADGVPSTVFSKWFGRFLDKAGLEDRALVFHSFRHTAEDAFRNALQPQYVIDRIIGHADEATSAGYGV